MKTLPRVLKITEITKGKIFCVFNTGEYRIVDLKKFAADYELTNDLRLQKLISNQEELTQAVVDSGTLSFPSIQQTLKLSNGQTYSVSFDLDPIMLYESSVEDIEREKKNRIGEQLKAARKSAGMTQEELASRVGTSKGYISRIENNRSDIELSTLRRIIEVGLNKRLAITD
ncbi:DNA-binding XRE family transcriptional regulator [Lewinella marina]|nr:helix-turn-helix transcriptional regulator [Neolewinella marina]NJB84313.1 DNA-binding XRE family transcriptional regulator [Neolewinella marina]